MKISVLIPTRNNFVALQDTVDSYNKLANDAKNIQIIIGIDIDDLFNKEIHEWAKTITNIKLIEFPIRHGYFNLHLYLNEMYKHAIGEYLIISSDDGTMTTNGWDTIMSKHEHFFHAVSFDWIKIEVNKSTRSSLLTFFALPKIWCEIIDGFGLSPAIDSWSWALIRYIQSKGYQIHYSESNIIIHHDIVGKFAGVKNKNQRNPDSFRNAIEKIIPAQAELIINAIKNRNLKI